MNHYKLFSATLFIMLCSIANIVVAEEAACVRSFESVWLRVIRINVCLTSEGDNHEKRSRNGSSAAEPVITGIKRAFTNVGDMLIELVVFEEAAARLNGSIFLENNNILNILCHLRQTVLVIDFLSGNSNGLHRAKHWNFNTELGIL